MGLKAGELLWHRMRLALPPGTVGTEAIIPSVTDIDTGLTQVNRNFDDMSPGEPGFGTPSRVQVIPMAPTAAWGAVTHSEPFLDPTTDTIHVTFFNNSLVAISTLNVFFWDEHSIVGPGEADTYNPPFVPPPNTQA